MAQSRSLFFYSSTLSGNGTLRAGRGRGAGSSRRLIAPGRKAESRQGCRPWRPRWDAAGGDSRSWEPPHSPISFPGRWTRSKTRMRGSWREGSRGCPSSSLLEWRYTFPLLENSGLETWALDILGWGFSDLETLPSCNVAAKREHLYQFWQLHIREPMMLVGPSLGAATAIDFAAAYPEAVSKLVLIDASVYAEGTGKLAKLPRSLAYAGVSILKSVPLRLYANLLTFNDVPYWTIFDWAKIGRLHCLLPWWEDATVDFMISGGYNVGAQIKEIKNKTLIIWGERDRVISSTLALRLHSELQDSILHQIPGCGHLPHVEEPSIVSKLIVEFAQCSLS